MKYDEIFEDTHLLELFNFGICVLDKNLNIKYWNSWLSSATNKKQEELKDKFVGDFFPSININKLKRQKVVAITIGSPTYFSSKEGYLFPVKLNEITNPMFEYMQQLITIYPIGNENVLLTIEDQTSLKEANKKVKDFTKLLEEKRKLLVDRLTGLPNRNQLLINIDIDENKKLALVNINGFNEINDFYGFEIGDKYLKDIAFKIKNEVSEYSFEVFRLAADEYAIYNSNNEIDESEFYFRVEKAIESVESMYYQDEHNKISIFLSSGVSFNQSKILETADIALKKCKKAKKSIVLYDDSINVENLIKEKHQWFEKVREAIEFGRIKAFFQPIYNIKTQRIEKYETLVRLIDTDGTVIAPYFFLDIAKQAKLYNEITAEVINQSFEKFKDTEYEFSLNISVEDIEHQPTIELLISKFKQYPNVAKRVVVELLEDEGIENFDMINSFISKIREYGAKVAIDDFGTGYSNFSYLLKLDIDYLKIDASLIKNIDKDENSKKIVKTLIDFSKKIGAKTIGEFVHKQSVLIEISNEDMDYAQGYYIQEPKENIGGKPSWKE
jgi:diguanylate cyclase (GGDEF)-like protein